MNLWLQKPGYLSLMLCAPTASDGLFWTSNRRIFGHSVLNDSNFPDLFSFRFFLEAYFIGLIKMYVVYLFVSGV